MQPAGGLQITGNAVSFFEKLQDLNLPVVECSKVVCVAELLRATEEAQIPLNEINEQDLPKLVVGRVFRWAIGYQRIKTGTKKRTSNIVFRDLPQWTKRDFVEAQADAARLMRFLGSDQSRAEGSVADSGQA